LEKRESTFSEVKFPEQPMTQSCPSTAGAIDARNCRTPELIAPINTIEYNGVIYFWQGMFLSISGKFWGQFSL
jgi:hypothetical protein